MIRQQIIVLPAMRRGYHLITERVLRELGELPQAGLLHLFLQHTSAALTINENADPSVRADFSPSLDRLALGTWQGIYLCEFRSGAGGRRIVATLWT